MLLLLSPWATGPTHTLLILARSLWQSQAHRPFILRKEGCFGGKWVDAIAG